MLIQSYLSSHILLLHFDCLLIMKIYKQVEVKERAGKKFITSRIADKSQCQANYPLFSHFRCMARLAWACSIFQLLKEHRVHDYFGAICYFIRFS